MRESFKFFVYNIVFIFLCYKVGIKPSMDGFYYLWKSNTLRIWIKTVYQIAFFPKYRIMFHVGALRKFSEQPASAESIGPGTEFLSWFQNLYPKETTYTFIRLTKKQKAFVYALSEKLSTHHPGIVFKMLNSPRVVNAWFTIAKILADRPMEKFDQLFESLSEQTSLPLSSNDLSNTRTMLAWLEQCLQFPCTPEDCSTAHINKANLQEWEVKSEYFFICESATICWKCRGTTPVYAIVLPSGYSLWSETTTNRCDWVQQKQPGILRYITAFSENPFQSGGSPYHSICYKDFSKSAQMHYWINHCNHCGIKQGDNALHHPGEAFWPLTIQAAQQLKIYKQSRPFAARCECLEFLCLEDIKEKSKESKFLFSYQFRVKP